MLELRCWESLWLKYVAPEGRASLHTTKLCLPSLSLHVVLPSWPISAQRPWGATKIIPWACKSALPAKVERMSGRREGVMVGPLPATANPCCVALQLSWLLELRRSRIRSGLSNVKAVTQTNRKLKIKGEILYCYWTAPCFTEIWHRPGINKWCCITQLYMLIHLGKPQT